MHLAVHGICLSQFQLFRAAFLAADKFSANIFDAVNDPAAFVDQH